MVTDQVEDSGLEEFSDVCFSLVTFKFDLLAILGELGLDWAVYSDIKLSGLRG